MVKSDYLAHHAVMATPVVNRLQHVLEPGGKLAPCPGCKSKAMPLVGRAAAQRRTVRCLGCGRVFMVDAAATDGEIAGAWNARARG